MESSFHYQSPPHRGRPSKKIIKYTEQNIQNLFNYIREYKVQFFN